MKHFYILLFIILFYGFGNRTVFAQNEPVAILKVASPGQSPETTKVLSVKHMVQVAGVPFVATANVNQAMTHSAIIATAGFKSDNLTDAQRQKLRTYVANGGLLIVPNFKDPKLYEVFGITDQNFSRNRYAINFDAKSYRKVFFWIDTPREKTVPIGNAEREKAIFSRSYTPGNAEVLARFKDDSPALIRNYYGDGVAYAFGVSFENVIVKNQLGLNYGAGRCPNNCFEPGSDVYSLILRGILMEHIPHLVWKGTAPYGSSSALILTHDVDAELAMKLMNRYAKFENHHNITATYFITTHYIDDALDGDYYTAYRDEIAQLIKQNQEVGSHSVGHFPDFGGFPFGHLDNTMASYTPEYHDGQTQNGTVLGELEVSQKLLEQDINQPVVAFRAGYLAYPYSLIAGLDTLGYQYASTLGAGKLMTSFPFRSLKRNSMKAELSQVWHIPMTISDVGENGLTLDNLKEVVDRWVRVTKKYEANGSPTVLLIHPTRQYKLRAEKMYLNRLSEDMTITSIKAYGDFWLQRNTVNYYTEIHNGNLKVYIQSNQIPEKLAFHVSNGQALNSIQFYDKNNNPLSYESKQVEGRNMVFYHSKPVDKPSELHMDNPLKLYKIFPNPFVRTTTITYDLKKTAHVVVNIYSMQGRKITTLLNKKQDAGVYWLKFTPQKLAPGFYIVVIRANSYRATAKIIYQ